MRSASRPWRATRRPRSGDIRHSLADISPGPQAAGYRPIVDFETGLQQTVDWYREDGTRR